MSDETAEAKTPEWMLLLETKKKRPHRLAHDIGAGAPCLSCGDSCPGLDLHFWRKLCRNCKCKKEEHDVIDDDGYEQFEILFSNSGKRKRTGAFLNIKVPETSASASGSLGRSANINSKAAGNNKGVAFDWVPPDVPEDVAAEYMQQLPTSKLPISGSDGALYRRQQLEKQVPLHDIDATKCHGLTPDEIQGLEQYVDNLKNNVVGQGRVMKLPVLYVEQRMPCTGPPHHQSVTVAQASVTGESRPARIASSQSAQSLRSLSSIPLPRPFISQPFNKDNPDDFPPPPLPTSLPPNSTSSGLKTPSAFLPQSYHNAANQSGTIDARLVTNLPLYEGSNAAILGQRPLTSSEGQINWVGARDGTFLSDQQSNEVAYSTKIPVPLVSQQSKVLKNANVAPNLKSELSSDCKNDERKGIITASRHPTGLSDTTSVSSDENRNIVPLPSQEFLDNMKFSVLPQDSMSGPLSQGRVHYQYDTALSSVNPSQESLHSIPLSTGISTPSGTTQPHDATFVPYTTNIVGQTVYSIPVDGDAMPKSAHVIQQSRLTQQELPEGYDHELAEQLQELTGMGENSAQEKYHLDCQKCSETLVADQVAVLVERAGKQAVWHPQCFVCCTCQELLVDLIYFYHKGNVYCGRHYAELLDIPRCFACDELIFVKEYTCAEGKAFHVKHFCCYECDTPLGGKQYVPKDEQPVCLQCFQEKYGKSCHTCKQMIAAGDQRVGWKNLNWHVSAGCFRCFHCSKSLLGGKFLVKSEQPFCSKDCALTMT